MVVMAASQVIDTLINFWKCILTLGLPKESSNHTISYENFPLVVHFSETGRARHCSYGAVVQIGNERLSHRTAELGEMFLCGMRFPLYFTTAKNIPNDNTILSPTSNRRENRPGLSIS